MVVVFRLLYRILNVKQIISFAVLCLMGYLPALMETLPALMETLLACRCKRGLLDPALGVPDAVSSLLEV